MNNTELANAVFYGDQVIAEAIANGATPEELQFLQDAQRAYKIALLTLNGRANMIAEVV